MNNQTELRGVSKQIATIRRQFRYVLFASSGPFLLLAIASIAKADNSAEKLLFAATFIFGFGLALIAAKVASHVVVERHLSNILDIDKTRSNFISTASHQLKTPVSALSYTLDAYSSALKKGDTESMNAFLDDLHTSIHRLKLLTGNLLDIAIIENDTIKMHPEEFKIRSTIEQISDEFKSLGVKNHQPIETNVSVDESQTAYCDTTLLYNVVENLLSNAFKYGTPEKPIVIELTKKDDVVKVAVTNETEEQLTKTELAEIFLKFSEGTAGKNSKSEGFGLGLWITKKYVEKWGGHISAYLPAPLHVTFAFTIPVEPVIDKTTAKTA